MIANSGDRNLLRPHIYRWASERDRGRESPPPAYSPANTPLGHETDAQSLTSLPGAVQRQSDPHQDEAGQGHNVHAEENVVGEHYPPRSDVVGSRLAWRHCRICRVALPTRCSPSCLPLTGRLVGSVDLLRLLPDVGDLLHREKARQLDVLNGTG